MIAKNFSSSPSPQHQQTTPSKPAPDPSFQIRQMTLKELRTTFEWANQFNWLLSPHDAEVCYRFDPNGFFAGDIGGQMICTYLCFKFGDYYFLTINIVAPEHQGRGYAKKIQELTKVYYQNGKTESFEAGGDTVIYYTKLGYHDFSGLRYYKKIAKGSMSSRLVNLKDKPIQEVLDYDLKVFRYPRENFLKACLEEESYTILGIRTNEGLKGYGILKEGKSKGEYVLAGVMADDKEIAKEILEGLQSFVIGCEVYMIVLDLNEDAIEVAKEQEWEFLYDYRRMYGGERPKIDVKRTYTEFGL